MAAKISETQKKEYFRLLLHFMGNKEKDKFSETLEEALNKGFPIDFMPPTGSYKRMTLLHCSLISYSSEFQNNKIFIQILLNSGAKIDYIEGAHQNALYYAIQHKCAAEIFEKIISQTDNIKQRYSELYNKNALEYLISTYVYRSYTHEVKANIKEMLKILFLYGYNDEDLAEAQYKISVNIKADPNSSQRKENLLGVLEEVIVYLKLYLEERKEMSVSPDNGYEYEYVL